MNKRPIVFTILRSKLDPFGVFVKYSGQTTKVGGMIECCEGREFEVEVEYHAQGPLEYREEFGTVKSITTNGPVTMEMLTKIMTEVGKTHEGYVLIFEETDQVYILFNLEFNKPAKPLTGGVVAIQFQSTTVPLYGAKLTLPS